MYFTVPTLLHVWIERVEEQNDVIFHLFHHDLNDRLNDKMIDGVSCWI